MNETKPNFEHFIAERFLEFYNRRESTNFIIKEKADEKERQKPSYDFRCTNDKTKVEMAIEIKRLFTKKKSHLKNIENWISKYIEKPLRGKIKGQYYLLIKGYESPFRKGKKDRKKLLSDIREELQSLNDPGGYYKLKCCSDIALARWSKEGSHITAWPVDFSHADDKEIVRILDASLRKFKSDDMINIILLVEHSTSGRGSDIVPIIEDLEHGIEPDKFDAEKRNFEPVSEIYHVGLHRDTVIARVHPKSKFFESGFFDPTDFMEINNFRQWANENLL